MPKLIQSVPNQVATPGITTQTVPEDFGTGRGLAVAAEAAGIAAEKIDQIEQKRRNRNDAINLIRSTDQFYNDVFAEFNRVQSEDDIINPATAETFNQGVRQKASEYLSKFQGSPEAKIKLEDQLLGQVGSFTQQMTVDSIRAQRKYLVSRAGEQISKFSEEARQNPAALGDVLKRANMALDELSPALYAEDEIDLTAAAQEEITLGALRAYTDTGQYEEAKELINDNPFFLQTLSPASQKQVISQIQSGIKEKERTIREIKLKIDGFRAAAKELGLDVPPSQIFSAVTGIEQAQSPQGKVEEFSKAIGKPVEQLSPSVIAKIGFGVDLPGQEIDFNKEFMPDGGLTPKGIQSRIKVPFEKAAAAKVYQNKISGAIDLFRNEGNKQALLSAMITFQKALDEGAIVREGDIALQKEAQGLKDRFDLFIDPFKTGQVVGQELVDEMESTINDFTAKALESSKIEIDPYIQSAKTRGFKPLDYGIPDEAYNNIFAGVKTPQTKSKTNKNVMTADEFLQQ